MKATLLFLVLLIATVFASTITVTELNYDNDDVTTNSTASTVSFQISYDNNTFETQLLNFIVEPNDYSDTQNTTIAATTITLFSSVYPNTTTTPPASTDKNNQTKLNGDGSAGYVCVNYTNSQPTSGNVWAQIATTFSNENVTSLSFTVNLVLADTCSADNAGGSNWWIWVIVIVAIVLVILVIIAAVAGFLYWKKKQSGNYALYNDS